MTVQLKLFILVSLFIATMGNKYLVETEDNKYLVETEDNYNATSEEHKNDYEWIDGDYTGQIVKNWTATLGKTDWGTWEEIDICPFHGKAYGFRLRVEDDSATDDSALNGIQLLCSKGGKVSSNTGDFGKWRKEHKCPTDDYLIGAQLRSQLYQGWGDDTAANNLDMFCKTAGQLKGDGLNYGTWGDITECPTDHWICGLRVKMEHSHIGDESGLNKVKFACCDESQVKI